MEIDFDDKKLLLFGENEIELMKGPVVFTFAAFE